MSDLLLLAVAGIAGSIGASASVALVVLSKWHRVLLWVIVVTGLGTAYTILAILWGSDRAWVTFISQLLLVIVPGVILLAIVRKRWPDVLPIRRRGSKVSNSQSRQPIYPPGPAGDILRDLAAKVGPDRARTMVGEAEIKRRKPDSPTSRGTSAPPNVVQTRIRRILSHDDPEDAQTVVQELALLGENQFAALKEGADRRTTVEQWEAFERFLKKARGLVAKVEKCRTSDEIRDRNWRDLSTRCGQAESALSGAPLDKYREYSIALSKIRNIIERREHPRRGQHPFAIRDFQDLLARDEPPY